MKRVEKYTKIDAHAHLGFGPALRLPVAELLHAADALHIERLAISIPNGPFPSMVRSANDEVLKAIRAHPDRLLGQCCINPNYPKEALEEAKRCLREGMCGLGELYTYAKANDPLFFPLVELCVESRVPMMWHAAADLALTRKHHARSNHPQATTAEDLADLAQRYPEAILIHGHIGGGGDWEYMCKALRDSPSVYLDTSGSVAEAGMIDFAVKVLGADRLLFATDMNFESGVGKLLSARLSEKELEQIFSGNFNRILQQRRPYAY